MPTLEARALALPPFLEIIRTGGPYRIQDARPIPSFLELIHSLAGAGVDLSDPAIVGVPERDILAFTARHRIDLDWLRQLSGNFIINPTAWQNAVRRFLGFQAGDPILTEVDVPLPVAEIHSPPIDGCESAYEIVRKREAGVSLKVEVRGVGAGGGVSTTITLEDKVKIEGSCGLITVPGQVEVVPWTNRYSGETIYIVSVTQLSESSWSIAEIPEGRTHLCSNRFDEVWSAIGVQRARGWLRYDTDFVRHELPKAGVSFARKRKVEGSREFSLGWGGIVELISKFSTKCSYPFTIVAKADYVGFYENRESEAFFWSWKPM
jgi:hypothetical protein